MIIIKHLTKIYADNNDEKVRALSDIDLVLPQNGLVVFWDRADAGRRLF